MALAAIRGRSSSRSCSRAAQERSVQLPRAQGWAAWHVLVIGVSGLLPAALLSARTHEAPRSKALLGDYPLSEHFSAEWTRSSWGRAALDRLGLADLALVQQKLVEALGRSSQALTSRAFTIGQNTLEFVLNFFVMLYLLFFLLRDGKSLSAQAARAMPLKESQTKRLLAQFATVVRATVKGNVVVALVQGTLGGLAFWVIGIKGARLWGAVMALLSLLPAVGSAWVGAVAIYLRPPVRFWRPSLIAWCFW